MDDNDWGLAFEFARYDDWNWELTVSASANGFCGVSTAYFSASDLVTFAEELTRYPLGHSVAIASGYGRVGEILDEHVGIVIQQVTELGQIAVVVHLAEADPQRLEARREVRLELLTTYERLRGFGQDVARALQGLETVATLSGELLI